MDMAQRNTDEPGGKPTDNVDRGTFSQPYYRAGVIKSPLKQSKTVTGVVAKTMIQGIAHLRTKTVSIAIKQGTLQKLAGTRQTTTLAAEQTQGTSLVLGVDLQLPHNTWM